MSYQLLCTSPDLPLIQRLLRVKNLEHDSEDFLNPTYQAYRQSPSLLSDIQPAVERILSAIASGEKILIFGDYDVDGICASYILYTYLRTYFDCHTVTIRLPHRVHDGYGIKNKHIDMAGELGCSLIITVDNGITATIEAEYAKQLGIDLIVTDHHHLVGELPSAYAVVNPQTSPEMECKEICGATVALKVCCAIAKAIDMDDIQIKAMIDSMMPFTAIATVADCMPLIHENRLIVTEGLRLMNTSRHTLMPSLRTMLEYLSIQEVDTYHIGYMIGPRLNATGRIDNAMEGLKAFLFSDPVKSTAQIEHMDGLNLRRKEIQEQMLAKAQELLDPDQSVLIVADDSFHEGIVGIVAGRLAEQYKKPVAVLATRPEKGIATGSLRGPIWFSIVDMLQDADSHLDRYGGHEQAGGLTVKLNNIEAMKLQMQTFAAHIASSVDTTEITTADTRLHDHECTMDTVKDLQILAPYGIGNESPLFVLENVIVQHARSLGRGVRTHLKFQGMFGTESLGFMQWGAGDEASEFAAGREITVIGKLKEDTYTKGVMVEVKKIIG